MRHSFLFLFLGVPSIPKAWPQNVNDETSSTKDNQKNSSMKTKNLPFKLLKVVKVVEDQEETKLGS